MSVTGLSISIAIGDRQGVQAVRSFALGMERLGTALSDFRFIFPRVVSLFEDSFAKQFERRGAGPVVGPWSPLQPSYAAWKAKHYPGKPLLERSGNLKEGLTAKSGTHTVRDYSASMLNFGTTGVPYASFHQTGTAYMPSRPPADFGPEFEKGLKKAMHLGIVDAARQAEPTGELANALKETP